MNNHPENTIIINGMHHDLDGIEKLAWKKLVNGAVKKKNGFRTMCVGTISENLDSSLRIVINRKVDESIKTIYFYTDNRSRKFQDLLRDNRLSLLFYDARQKTQIMVKAYASLHNNDLLASEKWSITSPQARLGYMTIEPPNTKSSIPTLGYDEQFCEIKPAELESNFFQKNFSVIACKVYELEFLYLNYVGNHKANFFYKNGVLDNCFWAVP